MSTKAVSLDVSDAPARSKVVQISYCRFRRRSPDLIEMHLMCVGGRPTLDFADATAFLAGFRPMIDMALARGLN